MKFKPTIDVNFTPLVLTLRDYKERVKESKNPQKVTICLERNDGYNYHYLIDTFEDGEKHNHENAEVVERLVKSLLWVVGGYKIYVSGSVHLYEYLKKAYSKGGLRAFDADFMEVVYENKFEVLYVEEKDIPKYNPEIINISGNLSGCRIGFDAGGSDRKVSAVIDGEVVYSEEVVWYPKINEDPKYHYQEILTAMQTAASHMPRVDAIGVSSAGIYVDNKVMVASLFLKVPKDKFLETAKNIYIDIAKTFGDVPLKVANDGDVSALAGAQELNDTQILGIAMGTSEAAGFVNKEGNFSGWLNELAFVPVDFNPNSMIDEWSGDYGCGVKYFSQDSVIKLAEMGGFKFEESLSPAQKLKVIQELNDSGNHLANEIFENIGIYLGYTLAYYAHFYDFKHLLLLGRVVSGKGGNTILEVAQKVLHEEFPEYDYIQISMPDEMNRRVGQSIAAASLPSFE